MDISISLLLLRHIICMHKECLNRQPHSFIERKHVQILFTVVQQKVSLIMYRFSYHLLLVIR